MKSITKIALLLVSISCLSSCVGKAEDRLGDERNIRWFSDDEKLQFTIEYDELEDYENSFKFWTGRGTLEFDETIVTFFAYVNMPLYHELRIMPFEYAVDEVPSVNSTDIFQVLIEVNFVKDVLGIFTSDITVLDGTTTFNHTDIAYFDNFDQKMYWEPLEEDEKNPLNYFMRTWINEDNGLSFAQDSPKLFVEQKIHGTLSDDSPVLLSFGDEDFTMCRYTDGVESDILLEGTYTTAVSSISLTIETNNLFPENPGIIVLE